MAIARIASQDAKNSSALATVSATYPGLTTAGNLLIAVVLSNQNSAGVNSITNLGWTRLVEVGTHFVSLFYKLADGTETIITSTATGANNMALDLFEYTGNANPIVTDGTPAGANNGLSSVTSYATPTITTTNANDLIFMAERQASISAPSWASSSTIGFNNGQSTVVLTCGEKIVSTIQTNFSDTMSWTTASNAAAIIGAFKAATGGSPAETQSGYFPIMGVGA